jgi:AP2-associated kinase
MNFQDNQQLANIKKEIELWRRCNNHSNIVKLFDFEINQSFVLILMEFCAEGTLFDMINNRQEALIAENQALYIIQEIANGIDHMHTQNPPIAHRDIKIENVLRVGNNFKLCDFGSTTTDTLDPRNETKNSLMEKFSNFEKMTTFMYRPPEMCDPYSKFQICEKVDIWMLGCIFYTILFKQHPFQDAQKLTIINAHYYIPETASSYSDKLIDFMRLMLTPNPTYRPSAKDVLNIITNWKNLKAIKLPPETQEIKEKQLQRNIKSYTQNLLSADDIYRVQQEILKSQAKKNKYKRKGNSIIILDEGDIHEIFEDMDFIGEKSKNQNSNNDSKPKDDKKEEFNFFENTSNKPFEGFEGMDKKQGKNNIQNSIQNNTVSQPEWIFDFNQGINNNPKISQQSPHYENNFGFEFLDNSNSFSKNNANSASSSSLKQNNNNISKNGFEEFGNFDFIKNSSSINNLNAGAGNTNSLKGFDFERNFDKKNNNTIFNSFTNSTNYNTSSKQPNTQYENSYNISNSSKLPIPHSENKIIHGEPNVQRNLPNQPNTSNKSDQNIFDFFK